MSKSQLGSRVRKVREGPPLPRGGESSVGQQLGVGGDGEICILPLQQSQ